MRRHIAGNELVSIEFLIGKVSDAVLYNFILKRIAVKFMNSRLITENPLYRHSYRMQMNRLMARCHVVPLHIMIENTNACNYRCPFCPHWKMTRKIGFMSFELYKKIIDECAELEVNFVDLHQFGEPLLDPMFAERVAYAKAKGIELVTTNTNGSRLAIEMSRSLVKAGLDRIVISLDAATEETYEKVRPPGSLRNVEDNIKNLIRIRESLGTSKPEVVLDFVQQPENRHEMHIFMSKWRGIVDKMCISYMHDWAESIDKRVEEFHGSSNREPCKLLWTDMVVSWDGRVPLCCVDYDNEVVLGDLRNETIDQVWSGERLRRIREAHLRNEFDEVPLCARCNYRSMWWSI